MKKWFKSFVICSMIFVSAVSAEALTAGKAYVVSSINVNASQTIQSGQSYSLVPQVVVATGNENYVGSVSTFTGCFKGKRYEAGEEKGNCLVGVVNSLTSTSTTDALSAYQGKVLNDKITNTYTKTEIDTKLNDLINIIYPVGAVYISTIDTSPSILFTGTTWEAIGQGRTLIGAGTGTDSNGITQTFNAGDIGGEYRHVLTVNEMPSHNHNIVKPIAMPIGANDILTINDSNFDALLGTDNFKRHESYGDAYNGVEVPNYGYTESIGYAGGGAAHNNMQPYLSVYMWKRTA